jgi:hypothetical protein
MANLLSTTVNGALSASGRISATYNTDRYQFNFYRASASNWWVTNDGDRLGLHLNNVGDKFYFATDGDFWSSANGWLSTALAAKQNASTAITTSNIGSQSVSYASSAGSTGSLSSLGSYVWSASTNGRDFYQGIQTSFVSANEGYPEYGSVVRVHTYPNDGGSAELYFPYSNQYGGSSMRYRLGLYSNAGWTGWKTVIDSDNIGSQSVNYAVTSGTSSATTQTNFAELSIGGLGVATREYVTSQGYLTSLPSHNHDDRYYTESESDGRYVPYGSITGSFGLNDNKLYLRTNGDNNHYLWNAADDWEELVYYTGTGFRVKGSTGTVSATFTDSGISIGTSSTLIRSFDAQGYLRIYGSSTNYLGIGPYNNNGWAYFENSGNTNGVYFNSVGRYAFDSVDVTPYTDAENSLGNGSYRWAQIYTSGWLRQYGAQGMYNQDYGTHFYSNGGASWAITGSGGNVELQFRSNHQSTIRGYVYADTSNQIGFLNNGGSWAFRTTSDNSALVHGANLTINADGAYASNITMNDGDEGGRVIHCNSNRIGFLNQSSSWGSWCYDDGSWATDVAMYSPIYYDSSNTAYYGDFNGISSMYGVAIRGDQSSTDTSNQIFFWSTGNTTTSAIGFKANGGYFTNPTGYGDGYNTYLTMDSPGRGWVFREGRGGADFGAAYTSGWILNNGVWQANASMRAPIFYDSADTSYYVDPNSTSRLNVLTSFSLRNNYTVDVNHTYGMYFDSAGSDGYAIFRESGSWAFPYPDLRISFHTGIKLGANASYNGIRFYTDTDMATQVMSVNNGSDALGAGNVYVNNSLQAGSSLRAPIFYDSNDTGYYLDPNSQSNLLYITMPHRGNGTENIVVNSGGSENWNAINVRGGANNHMGIGYHGTSRSVFGTDGISIHFDDTDSFRLHTNGWDTEFEVTGDGRAWLKNSLKFGTSTNNGTISGGGDWGIRFANDNGWIQFGPANNSWTHIYTDKSFYFNQELYVNGTQVVKNSGTWGINITGSAGTASAAGRASALDIIGYGSGNMTYYQTSGTFAGYSGWAGYFVSNHGDGATYYNQTIIMPFWGPPQYSRLQGGTFVGPYTFWSTENLNDYAPNMNQYVRTTDNVTFNTTTSPTILVNGHSDNTKGYRIHNTSGSSVSAMFTNSSNQLVIAAGAVDQINLNKKVLVNAVALGVNIAPSATAGRIDASNDIVAYSSSDERLKENITPIANALDKVKSLTGVEFDWKPEHKEAHGHEGHDTGIIAQQVLGVMPSAVRTNDTGYLAVRYEKLIGLLIEGMKEQQEQIEELKAQLNGLTK